jgi:hypothetical protein
MKNFSRTAKRVILFLLAGVVVSVSMPIVPALANFTGKQIRQFRLAVGDRLFGIHLGNMLMNVDNAPVQATSTVITSATAHTFDVDWKFFDANAAGLTASWKTYCYMSDSKVGVGYANTAGTSAFASSAAGFVESITSGKSANVMTDATGHVKIKVAQTSTSVPNEYICCMNASGMPLGVTNPAGGDHPVAAPMCSAVLRF